MSLVKRFVSWLVSDNAVDPTPALVGRNALCPCGSGRKFKKCCLESREASFREARQVSCGTN